MATLTNKRNYINKQKLFTDKMFKSQKHSISPNIAKPLPGNGAKNLMGSERECKTHPNSRTTKAVYLSLTSYSSGFCPGYRSSGKVTTYQTTQGFSMFELI